MSSETSLGWFTDPEPAAEHRRLGWVATADTPDTPDTPDTLDTPDTAVTRGTAVTVHPADTAVTTETIPTGDTETVSRETASGDRGAGGAVDMLDRPDLPEESVDDPGTTAAPTPRAPATERRLPRPMAPRVLTVANQKGGVGKTTTTVNIAAGLAQGGLRVLVIDLDPQGNASTALGIEHSAQTPSVYDVIVDARPLLDIAQPCPTVEGLFCAPATIDLAGAEIELVSLEAREMRLHRSLAAASAAGHAFDYILIDCPPSLGLLTVNAMVAASEIFIPIQCEYYALEGLSQLLQNVELVKAHLNPDLHVSTILLTMFDGRTRLSSQVADEVRRHFAAQVLRTTVPRSVRVSEAPSFGETVMTYDPRSTGALAYRDAAGEIADRGAREHHAVRSV